MSVRGAARPLSGHAPRECEVVLGRTDDGRAAVTLYAWGGFKDGSRIPFGHNPALLRQLIDDLQTAVAYLERDSPQTPC